MTAAIPASGSGSAGEHRQTVFLFFFFFFPGQPTRSRLHFCFVPLVAVRVGPAPQDNTIFFFREHFPAARAMSPASCSRDNSLEIRLRERAEVKIIAAGSAAEILGRA